MISGLSMLFDHQPTVADMGSMFEQAPPAAAVDIEQLSAWLWRVTITWETDVVAAEVVSIQRDTVEATTGVEITRRAS